MNYEKILTLLPVEVKLEFMKCSRFAKDLVETSNEFSSLTESCSKIYETLYKPEDVYDSDFYYRLLKKEDLLEKGKSLKKGNFLSRSRVLKIMDCFDDFSGTVIKIMEESDPPIEISLLNLLLIRFPNPRISQFGKESYRKIFEYNSSRYYQDKSLRRFHIPVAYSRIISDRSETRKEISILVANLESEVKTEKAGEYFIIKIEDPDSKKTEPELIYDFILQDNTESDETKISMSQGLSILARNHPDFF